VGAARRVGELEMQVLAGPVAADGAYAGEEAVNDAERARLPAATFDPVTGGPTVVWAQRIGPDGPGVPVAQVSTVLHAATRSLTPAYLEWPDVASAQAAVVSFADMPSTTLSVCRFEYVSGSEIADTPRFCCRPRRA
jgi:hypothetical protein